MIFYVRFSTYFDAFSLISDSFVEIDGSIRSLEPDLPDCSIQLSSYEERVLLSFLFEIIDILLREYPTLIFS